MVKKTKKKKPLHTTTVPTTQCMVLTELLSAKHCPEKHINKLMHLPCLHYCANNKMYGTDRKTVPLLNHD
jgi:hypothetical protein